MNANSRQQIYRETHVIPTARRVRVSISVPRFISSLRSIPSLPVPHQRNHRVHRNPTIGCKIDWGTILKKELQRSAICYPSVQWRVRTSLNKKNIHLPHGVVVRFRASIGSVAGSIRMIFFTFEGDFRSSEKSRFRTGGLILGSLRLMNKMELPLKFVWFSSKPPLLL